MSDISDEVDSPEDMDVDPPVDIDDAQEKIEKLEERIEKLRSENEEVRDKLLDANAEKNKYEQKIQR
ncbi:MAG: peptidase, partial [Halobacteria archaeon]|nr:peptidase [Halobacteria archaeon]